jgi:uridine kinase
MVSCGQIYALSIGPHVSSAGLIRGFELRPHDGGLLLHYGDEGPLEPVASLVDTTRAPIGGDEAMMREHQRWLASLGVTSIGAFNRACVEGEVTQIIRVAEGFHEKEIGQVADDIATRAGKVRVVCIAGPSSSGKTTFIKRLRVQLQVNGITPVPISLDDYYVDRERTPRDAKGELDFEAFDALDLALLQQQLVRLMAGEPVTVARYDFAAGKSFPNGGRGIKLGARDILMLEGIHGLNPRLLQSDTARDRVFRVFIHPMTSLPYDRLSQVDPSDMRLLRRIVRDRHTRGANAADNIMRWPSVRHGERAHIFPYIGEADVVFDSSLVYELSILKVFAERYLLEVPQTHPAYATAYRLRRLIDRFVAIYPDHVPPTSIIREFIGGSGFEY